jgi:hypothetical protein
MKEKRFSYWRGSIAERKLIIESWIERMRPKRQNRPEIALFSRLQVLYGQPAFAYYSHDKCIRIYVYSDKNLN